MTILAEWTITLQVAFLYWFAALQKSDALWNKSGNALFFAFNLEHFATPFGVYLTRYPDLLRGLTFSTLALEFVGPSLLFIPFYRPACRMIAVSAFLIFHFVGMQLTLRIGNFPWVCSAAWLLFIPKEVWDWFLDSRAARHHKTNGQACGNQQPPAPRDSSRWRLIDRAGIIVVALFFADVSAWNLSSVCGEKAFSWMVHHDLVGQAVGLAQRWDMYAPRPPSIHGWLVVPAELADGSEVDLFSDAQITWEKPKDIGAYFGSDFWRRYLSNLFTEQNPKDLESYAGYLRTRWDKTHDSSRKVESLSIVFMEETMLPDLTISQPNRKVIYFRSY